MNFELLKELHRKGLIGSESAEKINQEAEHPLVSVYWDLNTLLGIGVIALSTGLGILIYKNIDTIGHQVILALIAAISIACFTYCNRNKAAFSWHKVQTSGHVFDYILLLGTLTMLTFTAYLQYQYQVFGTHYGLATFLPMLALFFIAYYFDHIGILNMAILNLGVWMGVTVTPKQLLLASNYNSETIIYTYLGLGLLLLGLAYLTMRHQLKPHFKFSYQHYGVHVSFIALLSAYFYNYDFFNSVIWLVALLILAYLLYKDALKSKSFYFLLLAILYAYIAISCLAHRLISNIDNDSAAFDLMMLYVVLSTILFIFILRHFNKRLKAS